MKDDLKATHEALSNLWAIFRRDEGDLWVMKQAAKILDSNATKYGLNIPTSLNDYILEHEL